MLTESTGSTSFTDAMALTSVSSDDVCAVFEGQLNEHWTIGPKVHGGAMLALCANAARAVIDPSGEAGRPADRGVGQLSVGARSGDDARGDHDPQAGAAASALSTSNSTRSTGLPSGR